MAMIANLTIWGIVNYRPDVFDNLQLPTPPIDASAIGLEADQLRAAWTINKEDFLNFLCLQCMSMSVAVPDADFLKAAIGTWSSAHIHEWQRLFDTCFYKYNPIWNKDGIITEWGTDSNNTSENESINNSSNGQNTNTGFTHAYDGGVTHTDDNLTWTHADKTKGDMTAQTAQQRNRQNADTANFSHTTTEKGNIGVTMTQQMIDEERRISLFSIEEYIADEFKKNFCLMIW